MMNNNLIGITKCSNQKGVRKIMRILKNKVMKYLKIKKIIINNLNYKCPNHLQYKQISYKLNYLKSNKSNNNGSIRMIKITKPTIKTKTTLNKFNKLPT